MTDQTQNTWGIRTYLSGDDYLLKSTIEIKVDSFIGLQPYMDFQDKEREARFFYIIDPEKNKKTFRMSKTNELLCFKKYKITSPQALVGKTISLEVVKFGKNQGFLVVGVK